MSGRDTGGKFKKGFKHTSETRKKMSETRKRLGIKPPSPLGRKLSPETIAKIVAKNLGRKQTDIAKLHMSLARKGRFVGRNNTNWKGGIAQFQTIARGNWKYREWRDFVFQRDNYKCQSCGSNTDINAHHIYSFGKLLKENNIKTSEDAITCEKLWDLNNGVTLCKECHYKLHRKIK